MPDFSFTIYKKKMQYEFFTFLKLNKKLSEYKELLTFKLVGEPIDYDRIYQELSIEIEALEKVVKQYSRMDKSMHLEKRDLEMLKLLQLRSKLMDLNRRLVKYRNICLESSKKRSSLERRILRIYEETVSICSNHHETFERNYKSKMQEPESKKSSPLYRVH